MSITFEKHEIHSILAEVIKNELRSSIESTVSMIAQRYVSEELAKKKQTLAINTPEPHPFPSKEEFQLMLNRIDTKCNSLNKELTDGQTNDKKENEIGEKKTIRQFLEEIQDDMKSLKADVQGIHDEMKNIGGAQKVLNGNSLSKCSPNDKKKADFASHLKASKTQGNPQPKKKCAPVLSSSSSIPSASADKIDLPCKSKSSPVMKAVKQTSDESRGSIGLPTRGYTFLGFTMEEYIAAVTRDNSLTIEIANFLHMPLENYQLYFPFGTESRKGPRRILANTREVLTFRRSDDGISPEGVISYAIGNRGVSLHTHFVSGGTHPAIYSIALAFLPAHVPPEKFFQSPYKYKHEGSPGSFSFVNMVPLDATEKITVHDNDLHARAYFQTGSKAIITIEIFQHNP